MHIRISEDNDTEQPVEEDNWAAAVEFADSVGVDLPQQRYDTYILGQLLMIYST